MKKLNITIIFMLIMVITVIPGYCQTSYLGFLDIPDIYTGFPSTIPSFSTTGLSSLSFNLPTILPAVYASQPSSLNPWHLFWKNLPTIDYTVIEASRKYQLYTRTFYSPQMEWPTYSNSASYQFNGLPIYQPQIQPYSYQLQTYQTYWQYPYWFQPRTPKPKPEPEPSEPTTIVQWDFHPDGKIHYYDLIVSEDICWTWDEAKIDAENRTYLGVYGHLVTITSQDEQDFITSTLLDLDWQYNEDKIWLGGYQEPTPCPANSNWHWVTGEEWDYTNWHIFGGFIEPNDAAHIDGGNENRLEMWWNNPERSDGYWNDYGYTTSVCLYIIEYSI